MELVRPGSPPLCSESESMFNQSTEACTEVTTALRAAAASRLGVLTDACEARPQAPRAAASTTPRWKRRAQKPSWTRSASAFAVSTAAIGRNCFHLSFLSTIGCTPLIRCAVLMGSVLDPAKQKWNSVPLAVGAPTAAMRISTLFVQGDAHTALVLFIPA